MRNLQACVVTVFATVLIVHSTAQNSNDAGLGHLSFVSEFPLGAVKLEPGSPAARAADLNRQFLLMIDPDSLLWTFRETAGLSHTLGEPYWRSWEDPSVEVRGEFTGHFLSATALHYSQTGDKEILTRSQYLVSELKKVQDAIGTGYLSAFPSEHFDRLQSLQPVWAPFYVVHKIMAGLLDQHFLAHSDLALSIIIDMADYFVTRVDEIIQVNGTARWHETLQTEFGGMQEVLTKLHALTRNEKHLRLADLFIKHTFYEPLVLGEDILENRHANTHLAQVNGFVARFEHIGDAQSHAAVTTFFHHLTTTHSYASGGSNDNEFWGAPMQLGATFEKDRGINTQESCTTYNILKVARSLFRWSGSSLYADFYERALMNGVLGIARMPRHGLPATPSIQPAGKSSPRAISVPDSAGDGNQGRMAALHTRTRPEPMHIARHDTNEPGPGVYLYHMPMGRAGVAKADNFHGWGYRFSSFWCCYGTAVESLAKLADSVFFWRHNSNEAPELYVNQLLPSTLHWAALNLTITLQSSLFEDSGVALVALLFAVGNDTRHHTHSSDIVHLKVRLPGWTRPDGVELELDGQPLPCVVATGDEKGYCSVVRAFTSGQRLDIKLPMKPRVETLQDARPVFQAFKAVLIGPHLYAGLTHDSRVLVADPARIESLVSPVSFEGHLSLVPAWAPPGVFLRHDSGGLYVSQIMDTGDALDATFRLVPGLSASEDGWQGMPLSLSALQEWVYKSTLHPPVELVSLEAAGSPGLFVGLELGGLCSGRAHANWLGQAVLSQRPEGRKLRAAHTFLLRRGLSGEPGTLSFESVSKRGAFLATPYFSSGKPAAKHLQLVRLPEHSAWAKDASFRIAAPCGHLPEGSKVVTGDERSYIISPLSSIVDERYTAYFEWYQPPSLFRQYRMLLAISALALSIWLCGCGCATQPAARRTADRAAVLHQSTLTAVTAPQAKTRRASRPVPAGALQAMPQPQRHVSYQVVHTPSSTELAGGTGAIASHLYGSGPCRAASCVSDIDHKFATSAAPVAAPTGAGSAMDDGRQSVSGAVPCQVHASTWKPPGEVPSAPPSAQLFDEESSDGYELVKMGKYD